jgi:hypothetical protein
MGDSIAGTGSTIAIDRNERNLLCIEQLATQHEDLTYKINKWEGALQEQQPLPALPTSTPVLARAGCPPPPTGCPPAPASWEAQRTARVLQQQQVIDALLDLYKDVDTSKIQNESSCVLTSIEALVLGLSTKFCTIPEDSKELTVKEMLGAVDEYHRRIMLSLFFHQRPPTSVIPYNKFKFKWSPDPNDKSVKDWLPLVDDYITNAKERLSQSIETTHVSINAYNSAPLKAISSLANNKQIVIKNADKGLGVVILNVEDYIKMCRTHLDDAQTFEKVDAIDIVGIQGELRKILDRHNHLYEYGSKNLTKLASSLQQNPDPIVGAFYCLPKIHKNTLPIPGRPISSAIGTITEIVSQFVDRILRPILGNLFTICQSTRTVLTLIYV